MAISTTGIQLQSGPRWVREALELISSMRFSISLLTLIAIVSMIGTVVKQSAPAVSYVNQFGPFWADIFHDIGITSIYNTAWFILIMAFLVLSTGLCVLRIDVRPDALTTAFFESRAPCLPVLAL